jgi:hypothetical protein
MALCSASLRKSVANYLAHSFKPVTLTAPLSEWIKLDYKYPFGYVRASGPYRSTEEKLLLNFYTGTFTSSYAGHVPHVASCMAQMVGGRSYMYNNYHNINIRGKKDNDDVTFDTLGFLPERLVRMTSDFSTFSNASIEEKSSVTFEQIEKFWSDRVEDCTDSSLDTIIAICANIARNSSFRVKVIKAPSYNPSNEFISNYLSGPYDRNTTNINNIKDVSKSIVDRKWFTHDGEISPSTQLFFDNCKKYKSYYCNDGSSVYHKLFSSGGGIDLVYMDKKGMKHWRDIKYNLGFITSYSDLSGSSSYFPTKDIPYEEVVVLAEALRKEGAEIELS